MGKITDIVLAREVKAQTPEYQLSVLNALLRFNDPVIINSLISFVHQDISRSDMYHLLHVLKCKSLVQGDASLQVEYGIKCIRLLWWLHPLTRICLKEHVSILEEPMPTAYVKKLAKETGKTVEEVEAVWDEAKKDALKSHKEDDPRYWGLVTTITKNKLGIKDEQKKE